MTHLEASEGLDAALLLQRAQHLELDTPHINDGLDASPSTASAAILCSLLTGAAIHQLC